MRILVLGNQRPQPQGRHWERLYLRTGATQSIIGVHRSLCDAAHINHGSQAWLVAFSFFLVVTRLLNIKLLQIM